MINIKKTFSIIVLLALFFNITVHAQKTNQFDENGKRTGVWKKYYDNGKLRYSGEFKEGKEVGVFKFYSTTSSLQPVIVKNFVNDTASVKFFTELGVLKSKGKMVGKNRTGKWFYYFTNGKVFSEENYKDGKLNGVVKNYYANGKLTQETFYKEGLKNGTSKTYTDNSVLIEEVYYENGKLEKEAKFYDLKGGLKQKGNYKNGKRIGKWEFYMDGELVEKQKKLNLSELKNKK